MFKRGIILFLALVVTPGVMDAQDIVVESFLEQDSSLIGEQINYTISVKAEKELHSIVPLDDRLFPDGIEILSTDTDSAHDENIREYRSKYLITSFDSGIYTLQTIPVLINDFQKLDTVFTTEVEWVVYSPEVDTAAAIRDIKNPVNTPFRLAELKPYLPYIAGGLVLIGGILIYYFYFLRRRKIEEKEVEKLPPHIKAVQALDKIKNEKLWQKGRVKEYYSLLSDTVRTYIEERYEIPAMESVTGEILEDFKKYSWDDESLMEILESLLQLSDLVKFAREDPEPSDNETNLNNAYIFIEKTKPTVKLEEEALS